MLFRSHARTIAPVPSNGDGQYIIALEGGLVHQGVEKKSKAVVFVKPDEPAFDLVAGAHGCQGLILNFPQVTRRATVIKPAASPGNRKWQCILCAFFYDEALGLPDEGIPAGTRWEDVADTWTCPDCAAGKGDFQMMEVS